MMATIYLLEEGTSEGHHVVSDMKGCTLSHIAKLNLMTVKKFFFYLQVFTISFEKNFNSREIFRKQCQLESKASTS